MPAVTVAAAHPVLHQASFPSRWPATIALPLGSHASRGGAIRLARKSPIRLDARLSPSDRLLVGGEAKSRLGRAMAHRDDRIGGVTFSIHAPSYIQ
jgi:hypothetical protein